MGMIPCGLHVWDAKSAIWLSNAEHCALCCLSVVSWLSTMQGTDSVKFIMPVFAWRNWKKGGVTGPGRDDCSLPERQSPVGFKMDGKNKYFK